MSSKEAVEKIQKEIERLGRKAYEIAKEITTKEKFEHKTLHEAVSYFIQEWRNFQHPALLAIACEAVGGNPEKTASIGAALVLLTGAADIHDDIIDKSKTKGSKATAFGKFGQDISLLAGDALLFEGLTLLNAACETLPKEHEKTVQELLKRGFFELGTAEAKEASLKGNWNLTPEEYLDIIRRKAAVAEATARIGAVVGGATQEEVEEWGKIGRIFGMLMNIRDEFVDIFEAEELRNRRDNECLPLPMLYAMCNPKAKEKITHLLKKKELTDDDAMEVADVVLETKEVQIFRAEMRSLIEEGKNILSKYKRCKSINLLRDLLRLALANL
ncbi:MAG: polyprenyl synthetase family protein [Candidatus Bathyarchaeota archaeon]|nr:polyprenyl synthetase family protein [Candidatus Bathyarchaeota archaeon]